ncbi:preprotein translocase subunit SecY [Spiroplasma endosymbiont of Labia minor]|uniref:preprotein translocase subunit SecY n=1 Tax=Spiroplasma endosymbiont of Labia minor TaxID=3066305 RepID=UPI0030CEAB29
MVQKDLVKKQKRLFKNKKQKNTTAIIKGNFFVRNKDLVYRVLFTLGILVLIRMGTYLTVPGIKLSDNFQSGVESQQFFQLLSTLGGGSIGKFSILALGVSPFITASIITQLLSTDVIPVLTRWAKSGERGRRKLDRLTKFLTIPFALMQGIATIFTLIQQGLITPKWSATDLGIGPSWFYYILVPVVLLGGTFLMLWLADEITTRGIGNGVSIVIFTGIVAQMPNNFQATFKFWVGTGESSNILFDGILKFMIYIVGFFLVIFFLVIMNEAERKIPIQQTGSGLVDAKDHTPYLPLKVNNAGVIPVIFSSAIISTPITISQILQASNPENGFVLFTNNYLSFSTWWGIGIYAVLTILFTFLYAQVQINPEKIAENFQKSGTFIPGVKPGKDTRVYLRGVVNRLSWVGSFALAAIAILPYIISKLTNLPSSLAIGGTGLIIVISVALQTYAQIKGRIIQQSFIDKKSETFGDTTNLNENKNSHIW